MCFSYRNNSSQLHGVYVDKYRCQSLVLFAYVGVNVHGHLCLENNGMLSGTDVLNLELHELPVLDF